MTDKLDPNALREAVSAMKAQFEMYEELVMDMAKLQRSRFLALVESGFTEVQALELCKTNSVI